MFSFPILVTETKVLFSCFCALTLKCFTNTTRDAQTAPEGWKNTSFFSSVTSVFCTVEGKWDTVFVLQHHPNCGVMLTLPCVWFFRGALDHIIVTTKDGKFPLNQLGQISQKSPQLIVVNMTSFPEVRTYYWRHGKGRYLPREQTGWYWAKKQVDKSSHTGQGLRARTALSLLVWRKLCFAVYCTTCAFPR